MIRFKSIWTSREMKQPMIVKRRSQTELVICKVCKRL